MSLKFLFACIISVFAELNGSSFAQSNPQDCKNDPYLRSFGDRKIGEKDQPRICRAKYTSLGEYLSKQMKVSKNYCGFKGENIVYLLRQAAAVSSPGKKRKHFFSSVQDSAALSEAIISELMYDFFAFGKFGVPKSNTLANCWLNARGNFSECNKEEIGIYSKLHLGVAPSGFKGCQ